MIDSAGVVHISEVFGPTVQGEGPDLGRRAVFVRLGGCNLTCAGCDTPYTWNGRTHNLRQEITSTPAVEVVAQVHDRHDRRPGLVVVSGGEPMLHQGAPGFRALFTELDKRDHHITVETNGTIAPQEWLLRLPVTWTVSPKVAGPLATDAEHRRLPREALDRWVELAHGRRAAFKFVAAEPEHVTAVADLVGRLGLDPDRVYVMPAGTTAADVLAAGARIADPAIAAGFHLTTRLHLLLWPAETRGR